MSKRIKNVEKRPDAVEGDTHDEEDPFLPPKKSFELTSEHANLPSEETDDPVEKGDTTPSEDGVGRTGKVVLCLLIFQTCSKTLLTRYIMKDHPGILTAAAVLGTETTKLVLSTFYILFVERNSLASLLQYAWVEDFRHTVLLGVPAAVYSLQMGLEYMALSLLDAAIFSVLMQLKLLVAAFCSFFILRKTLKHSQVISLLLLTTGAILCNLDDEAPLDLESHDGKGIAMTLIICLCSGFASVYTEKVLKAPRKTKPRSLAYMQAQLAGVSLLINGFYVVVVDWDDIHQHGLWHNFTPTAFLNVVNTGLSGLVTAAVLKYADAILKGYATSISLILIGLLNVYLFDFNLTLLFGIGVINVVCATILYNGRDLDKVSYCESRQHIG